MQCLQIFTILSAKTRIYLFVEFSNCIANLYLTSCVFYVRIKRAGYVKMVESMKFSNTSARTLTPPLSNSVSGKCLIKRHYSDKFSTLTSRTSRSTM